MKWNCRYILRWPFIALMAMLLLCLGGYTFNRSQSNFPGNLIEAKWKGGTPGTKCLVVVVHGYRNGDGKKGDRYEYGKMGDVVEAVMGSSILPVDSTTLMDSAPPDNPVRPDVLYIRHPSGTFSNADCCLIASEISAAIESREASYEDIRLVGYSMGALLARKAYVYGRGQTQDLGGRDDVAGRASPKKWVTKAKRFVLLAGMNRGWTTMSRPKGMEWKSRIIFGAGNVISSLTRTGKMIHQCEKGAPFVANLRMQWLNVMNDKDWTGARPVVVQLLGSKDDIVNDEDSRDVSVCGDFIWVQLSGTGHQDILQLGSGDDMQPVEKTRHKWFLSALEGREDKELARMSTGVSAGEDAGITEAVIVLHGIRDYGFWTADFSTPLQESFIEGNPASGKLLVYRPSYGYFPMGSFLLTMKRDEKVRWFMDEVTELKAKYPNLKDIHFVGHSNGTYILATALKEYKALEVERVVLAGSVLRQDYDWTSPALKGRVKKVHNFVATGDWVVACFPRLFEIWPFTVLGNEIGGAGHNGFKLPESAKGDPSRREAWNQMVSQTTWVQGGHGAALSANGIKSMKPFVLKGEPITSNPNPGDRSSFVEFLGYVPWLVWILILTILCLLGRLWVQYTKKTFGYLFNSKVAATASLVTYCVLIFFIVENV